MKDTVQSIDRAFDILEVLATQKDGLGVTEIARRIGLHKSTVYRLLASMASRGYIEKNEATGAYRLGLKLVELCSLYLNSLELKTEAQPYLRRLAALTAQPVHLAILDHDEAVYIDKIESFNTIRMYSAIGKRVPLYCTAVGKVLLMNKEDSEIRKIFQNKQLTPRTANTITDIEKLISEIDAVRERGWAVDNEEHEEGIRCIAAPVYDYRNEIIAAVSTSGLKTIISPERDEEIAKYVVETAREISKRMGYSPRR
ncbi:MAG: IclR family transcriptional regulator, regulon repressor [Clostridiales bacterium]|jgi:DNA-binding IclR family transcriptional regulator|nr:IclR family transcriptional regulator, regulon repressor [Clostridiales bacterium]